jgi:hypothetical protein
MEQATSLDVASERTPSRVSARTFAWAALFSLGMAGLSSLVLGLLPYSTSIILPVPESAAAAEPGGVSRLGALVWDYDVYRRAPELEEYRVQFSRCAGLEGRMAARCVTASLSERSPYGEPAIEFFYASYDPAQALRFHLGGAPGHCTTRSALVATGLLSLGVPARVVQLLPKLGKDGHNVIEVWDEAAGWVLFDPVHDSSYMQEEDFVGATEIIHADGRLHWKRPHDAALDPSTFAGATVHYPEPWLYTRVGKRCARWPFRGCFAQIGDAQFLLGSAQRTSLGSAIAFALVALVLAFQAWRVRAARHA